MQQMGTDAETYRETAFGERESKWEVTIISITSVFRKPQGNCISAGIENTRRARASELNKNRPYTGFHQVLCMYGRAFSLVFLWDS